MSCPFPGRHWRTDSVLVDSLFTGRPPANPSAANPPDLRTGRFGAAVDAFYVVIVLPGPETIARQAGRTGGRNWSDLRL
jgi:hypothetical protein